MASAPDAATSDDVETLSDDQAGSADDFVPPELLEGNPADDQAASALDPHSAPPDAAEAPVDLSLDALVPDDQQH